MLRLTLFLNVRELPGQVHRMLGTPRLLVVIPSTLGPPRNMTSFTYSGVISRPLILPLY